MIFGGSGGSFGSTTASMITGPGVSSACCMIWAHRAGSSIRNPRPPHASANLTWSIGSSSTPYWGVAQEDQLLPLDHAQLVVLEHDHFYGQAIFDTGRKLGHQHGEATVADKRDALSLREGT